MTTTSAHDATTTKLCKYASCDQIAAASRGRYAGLCDMHARSAKVLAQANAQRPTSDVAATNGVGTSLEKRARSLVAVGKKVDRARARYVSRRQSFELIENELKDAMREWREMCRALAGDPED